MNYSSAMSGEGYDRGCVNGMATAATLCVILLTQEDGKMVQTPSSASGRWELRLGVLVHFHKSTGADWF